MQLAHRLARRLAYNKMHRGLTLEYPTPVWLVPLTCTEGARILRKRWLYYCTARVRTHTLAQPHTHTHTHAHTHKPCPDKQTPPAYTDAHAYCIPVMYGPHAMNCRKRHFSHEVGDESWSKDSHPPCLVIADGGKDGGTPSVMMDNACAHTFVCAVRYVYQCVYAHVHVHVHVHVHAYVCCVYACICVCKCEVYEFGGWYSLFAQTHTHVQLQTHTRTHAHTHTDTHTSALATTYRAVVAAPSAPSAAAAAVEVSICNTSRMGPMPAKLSSVRS